MNPKDILSALDVIEQSIKLAELDTTAEFKVHLEMHCRGEAEVRAKQLFETMTLKQTEQRNAVFIYVAVASRKYNILYDEGILQTVDHEMIRKADFILLDHLRNDKLVLGVIAVIEFLIKELSRYFPYIPCDTNEIGDEISHVGLG